MNRIELLQMATDSHRHREIERTCGNIAAVQSLVTEVVAQDTKIRKGFLLIAGMVGTADDVTLAENQAKRAKETQAMLWQAMSDPALNPDLAASIALRQIQGPDIS